MSCTKMHLKVDGIGDRYFYRRIYCGCGGILVSLTKYLTLFPGDVVSGRISTAGSSR
ncbi:MAG: hypothetical protein ACLSBB_12890 [Ruthenibacterium lactatiformans]